MGRTDSALLSRVHKLEPTADMQQAAEAQLGREIDYFDSIAYSFHERGLEEPVTFDLDVTCFHSLGEGKGLTTGNFRFPHKLLEIQSRIERGLYPPNADGLFCRCRSIGVRR